VFDGHAGKSAATDCAAKFPTILESHLPKNIGGIESVAEPLRAAFAEMDQVCLYIFLVCLFSYSLRQALLKYEDEGTNFFFFFFSSFSLLQERRRRWR
jgi:hypothetical protein